VNGGGRDGSYDRGSGSPLARRLLWPFRRTQSAMVVGLVLWCAGLVGMAGATVTEFSTAGEWTNSLPRHRIG